MPFGKYAGQALRRIPADYLSWLLSLGHLRNPLRAAVQAELERRAAREAEHAARARDVCPDAEIARQLIDRGLRVMARENHPDLGGDHATMVAINATAEWLRAKLRELSA
jgi:hypothetical protein